jgi:hypothetical protein
MTEPTQTTAEVLAMSKAIIDLVNEQDTVSFAELANHIEGFAEKDGVSISQGTKGGGRIVFWTGMSSIAADAVHHATESEQITVSITEPLVYLIDGCVLTLPIADNQEAFDKPGAVHWLPIAFRPVANWPVSNSMDCFHRKHAKGTT